MRGLRDITTTGVVVGFSPRFFIWGELNYGVLPHAFSALCTGSASRRCCDIGPRGHKGAVFVLCQPTGLWRWRSPASRIFVAGHDIRAGGITE